MEVSYQHSSKYLLFSSAQESESYRFGKTYGCVNYVRIFGFWWT